MTSYGRKGRRRHPTIGELTPRDLDDMRVSYDRAELDRFDAEQMAREPADDPGEQARADRWLTDSDEAA